MIAFFVKMKTAKFSRMIFGFYSTKLTVVQHEVLQWNTPFL